MGGIGNVKDASCDFIENNYTRINTALYHYPWLLESYHNSVLLLYVISEGKYSADILYPLANCIWRKLEKYIF